jgi:site-specific recombinase XerC
MLNAVTQRAVFSRYLTEDQERQLFRFVAQFQCMYARRDHAWMRLLRQTGIRVESCALLTVDDAVTALRLGRLRVRPETAKGGRGYELPINLEAEKALRDLLKVRDEFPGSVALPDGPLILSRNHRGMSVRSFQARMAEWVKEAGLPVDASPHWLRHTLAKRIVKKSTARDPIGIVQIALGHTSRASTQIYVLPDKEDVARALQEAAR